MKMLAGVQEYLQSTNKNINEEQTEIKEIRMEESLNRSENYIQWIKRLLDQFIRQLCIFDPITWEKIIFRNLVQQGSLQPFLLLFEQQSQEKNQMGGGIFSSERWKETKLLETIVILPYADDVVIIANQDMVHMSEKISQKQLYIQFQRQLLEQFIFENLDNNKSQSKTQYGNNHNLCKNINYYRQIKQLQQNGKRQEGTHLEQYRDQTRIFQKELLIAQLVDLNFDEKKNRYLRRSFRNEIFRRSVYDLDEEEKLIKIFTYTITSNFKYRFQEGTNTSAGNWEGGASRYQKFIETQMEYICEMNLKSKKKLKKWNNKPVNGPKKKGKEESSFSIRRVVGNSFFELPTNGQKKKKRNPQQETDINAHMGSSMGKSRKLKGRKLKSICQKNKKTIIFERDTYERKQAKKLNEISQHNFLSQKRIFQTAFICNSLFDEEYGQLRNIKLEKQINRTKQNFFDEKNIDLQIKSIQSLMKSFINSNFREYQSIQRSDC
ncbi:unnamed protein product [Paramecium octaurelia]|uniref:Uncharacterized protein n=1 Tax=Paramecium octaurelia TaxID=43137 RepID=A0A8S1VQ86_PAROT|nr:unnamed protein product [Paramecium octaurelia]